MLVNSYNNLLLVLAVCYFQQSSRPLLHRAGISAMIASDTLCTFTICAKIYLVVSLYPSGPPHGFPEFTLQTSAAIICSTYTTASLAKLFLCALYFNCETKRRVISAILLFGIVFQLAFGYASAVLLLTTGSPYGWATLISRIGSISSAVMDSMIAAVLLYTFIRMDATSAFERQHISKRLICVHISNNHRSFCRCSLLRRLIALFFSSGVIVASTTLLAVILGLNGRSAYLLFFYSQGRVYALTILGNFAVGIPAQHTPTTTPKLNTITGAVFPVKHTSADDQAGKTCDRARQFTLLRPLKC
ncbi:hypothetical protein B0H13DRAFT_2138186 [Mycena leptocephala]|nr:hypothetical protein B0H13DRAFT_2138186 [Mycena leptocephala]